MLLAAAALAAGFAAGYAIGGRQAAGRTGPPRSAAAAAPAANGPAVGQSAAVCSAQIGRLLQLGVQVSNFSGAAVTLRRVSAILPLGGLRAISVAWNPCGVLPPTSPEPGDLLPAGASTWFTITFRVLVRCPAPLPVQFTVGYARLGRRATASLPGFADLSHVPYSSCPAD